MGNFPAAVIIAVGASRVFLAWMAGANASFVELDPCDDWGDIFSGCSGIAGSIFSFVVGTIPGMPVVLNGLQAFAVNVLLFWAIRQVISGVG